MKNSDRIFVIGLTGLISSGVYSPLQANGFIKLLLARHSELELADINPEINFLQALSIICRARSRKSWWYR